jgi:Spy/CpxP family protein refolding chaperone
MSNLRAALGAALILGLAPLAASAQSAPPAPAAQPHHHGGWMHALHSVNLTADQRAQIKSLAKQTRADNQNADPATKRANIQKLRAQIDGLLTPDQRSQFQAAIAAQRAAH